MDSIRTHIHREEFDYPALMSALARYANPHRKVTGLLRSGEVIRVKKGLYIFGEELRRRPFSRELLANLMYGPSFVSLDYVLSLRGLIPERVATVTSVTTGRATRFDTPVGRFVYRPVPVDAFRWGMQRVERGDVSYLIASPERALADKVREDRKALIRSLADAEAYLFENLRVDVDAFRALNPTQLEAIARALKSRKALFCAKLLSRMGALSPEPCAPNDRASLDSAEPKQSP